MLLINVFLHAQLIALQIGVLINVFQTALKILLQTEIQICVKNRVRRDMELMVHEFVLYLARIIVLLIIP
jgi:hypothetical protein